MADRSTPAVKRRRNRSVRATVFRKFARCMSHAVTAFGFSVLVLTPGIGPALASRIYRIGFIALGVKLDGTFHMDEVGGGDSDWFFWNT